jgi:uncharacterized membrane-anchored protein YitT (DUF2179 family)
MLFLSRFVVTFIGSLILAIGINFFLVPFKVLDGGIIGIALIIKYIWGAEAGLTIILCSIPIYVFAWFRNRNFFYNSLHGMLVSSFFIDFVYSYHYYFVYYVPMTPLSSSMVVGILIGIGIGIMLRYETSTGGTDMLAQFLSKAFSVNVGVIILVIDAIIIALGGLLISPETFFLSIVTIIFVGVATSLCNLKKSYGVAGR